MRDGRLYYIRDARERKWVARAQLCAAAAVLLMFAGIALVAPDRTWEDRRAEQPTVARGAVTTHHGDDAAAGSSPAAAAAPSAHRDAGAPVDPQTSVYREGA